MHAIRLHAFGPPDHLVLEQLADPSPREGEVRIKVEASGVHLVDTTLRSGAPGPIPLPELPTVPGREVAGVVDLLGHGVDEAWAGARVVAHLGTAPGGYAGMAVTASDRLFRVPDSVDLAEAVAAVGTGRTALGVLELEPVGAGDVVLVLAAAGGLGWLLVQAAREAGATVVAAARGAAKVGRLAGLLDGKDLAVDYDDPDWATVVRGHTGGVTVVHDGVGGPVGRAALELLRPGGRHVMFGFSAGSPTRFDTGDVIARGLTVSWSLGPRMQALPGGIEGLAERSLARLAEGRWRPLVTAYPLAEAARAHRDLEERRTVGTVLLLAPQP